CQMTPRPAGRHSGGTGTVVRTQPLVRDRSAGAPYRVEFDVRTVYDFVFSLSGHAGSTEDIPESDRRWLTEAKATLPDRLGSDFETRFASEEADIVAGLAVDRPDVTSASSLVDLLASTEPEVITGLKFADAAHDPEMRPLVERGLAGDAQAIYDLTCDYPEAKREVMVRFVTHPREMKGAILSVLTAW